MGKREPTAETSTPLRDADAATQSLPGTAAATRSPAPPPPSPGSWLSPGDLVADRYEIAGELGRGGAGAVYKAFDRRARDWVALKILDPNRWPSPRSAQQLDRELRFGRAIQHPNVCRLFDVFEADGRCLLAMEYASQGTLRDTIRERGANRPFEEKLSDIRSIAAGLAAMHNAGLVHRDLKPENILRVSDGRLVLSDFGVSRALEQTTLTTGVVGTPAYLAPEARTGVSGSQASDVWALGVVLVEILTGERIGYNRTSIRTKVHARGLDARAMVIARLCESCLAPNPERRPQNGREIARRLESALRRRGMNKRLAALTLCLLVAFVGVSFQRTHGRRPLHADTNLALGANWSQARIVLPGSCPVCWQAMPPDRHIVRLLAYVNPPRVLDLDVTTGKSSPAPVSAEYYGIGCPRWSPDGKTVLFPKAEASGQTTIMYSRKDDGSDAIR